MRRFDAPRLGRVCPGVLPAVLTAVVLLLVPISGAAQAHGKAAQIDEWHRDVHRAAQLYAAGDTAGALALLDKRDVPVEEQRDLANTIVRDLELYRAQPKLHPVWTTPLVRALAALHMEGAIDAYNRKSEPAFGDHIAIGDLLFADIARIERRPDSARAWKLAIGLTAVSEGRLVWALAVLDAACKQYPEDSSLLLACGSAHEAVAMLPADVLARWPVPLGGSRSELRALDTLTVVSGVEAGFSLAGGGQMIASTGAARTAHTTQLDTAVKLLERVLKVDPANVEAHLRLGHLLTMKGQDKDAAAVLEKIVSGTLKADTRAEYLAGLFLGAIEVRAKRFDRAAATLRAASGRIPTAQSALIALAWVMHSRGERAQSADVLDHAVQPSDEWTDPWWRYRYAQYWVIEPLLASLRKAVAR
jgi:tetratricopeptide (TPR) repeat protein